MDTRLSLALIPLGSLALACTHPGLSDPPDLDAAAEGSLPESTRPEPAAIAAGQAVVVPQLRIEAPASWRFEPGGSRVAAALGSECGVWQLGRGEYLGAATSEGPASPCASWKPLEPITMVDGATGLSSTHPDGKRQLVLAGDRFELSGGAKPLQGRVRGERRYRTAAFSPDGGRLALFVAAERGAMQIEIWNLATNKLERQLGFAEAEDTLAKRFWLRWDSHSLEAIAQATQEPCDPDADNYCRMEWGPGSNDTYILQVWTELDAEPQRHLVSEYGGEQRVEQLMLDPEARWLIAVVETLEPRDGTSYGFVEIPLIDEDAETGLMWWSTGSGQSEALDTTKLRQWSSVVGSSFITVDEYDGGYEPWAAVTWSLTSLTARPIPDATFDLEQNSGMLAEGESGQSAWRVALAGRSVLLGDTDQCPASWEIEEAQENGEPPPECTQTRVAPEGCTLHDASWAFDRVLLSCQNRWLLAPIPDAAESIDLGQATELARGSGEPNQVVWGPGGLAIWSFSEGLRLFHDDALVASHTDVIDMPRALLDEELDLALVRERGGLRVLDLRSGELGPALAWTERIDHAAFAPDRSQLAVAGEGEVAVFLRADAEPVARWRTGKLAGMAWRQDSEVLYVGGKRALPELALDPNSGELVASAQLDRVAFDRIAAAELDPSWRWAIEEDGTFLRTIDGQAIHLVGENAISESGWFSGLAGAIDYHVRIGPDSPAPVYDLSDVADQLERPDLVAEFFAGKPLPRAALVPPAPKPAPKQP